MKVKTNYKCNEQRSNNFSELEIWEEDSNIMLRKESKYMGVIELTEKEAVELMKELADRFDSDYYLTKRPKI